jgi:hypothetical protein
LSPPASAWSPPQPAPAPAGAGRNSAAELAVTDAWSPPRCRRRSGACGWKKWKTRPPQHRCPWRWPARALLLGMSFGGGMLAARRQRTGGMSMKARYYSARFTCWPAPARWPPRPRPRCRTISVTASGQRRRRTPAAVTQKTMIDRAEIEALGGLSIGEVIRKLPGIDAGAYAGDGNPSANVRGMGRDAVQFLVDGERPTANSPLRADHRWPAALRRTGARRNPARRLGRTGGAAPITVNLIMKKARPQATAVSRPPSACAATSRTASSRQPGRRRAGFSWMLPLTINHHGMPLEKPAAPPGVQRRPAHAVAGRKRKQPVHARRIHRFAAPELARRRAACRCGPASITTRANAAAKPPAGLCQSGCRHRLAPTGPPRAKTAS